MTILKLTQFRADGTTSPLVIVDPTNLFVQATQLSVAGPHVIGETPPPRDGSVLSNGTNQARVTETPDEVYSRLLSERGLSHGA